ncbi:MAG: response regulator [Spirochaetes bacterium]|nr:response regulator [Spirochaetota bacterium]MBU0955730.1 response regulator [Spirochaetota bacterium]
MPKNILLIDDEAINLMALKSTLRRDYEVYTAMNAQEALAILQTTTMFAIVSDQKMPGMRGTELFALCREKKFPGLRIIVSGYDDDATIQQALRAGLIHAVLSKPLRITKLKALLDQDRS